MSKQVIFSCCMLLLFLNCNLNKKARYTMEQTVMECFDSWKYEDLTKEQQLKVLIYNNKQNRSIISYPNLIIGINTIGDTIAILDKDFEGKLLQGETVLVEPHYWIASDKEYKKPMLTIRKKNSENMYYCAVSVVYYGKLVKRFSIEQEDIE